MTENAMVTRVVRALVSLVLGLTLAACGLTEASPPPTVMPTPLGGGNAAPAGLFDSGRADNGCGDVSRVAAVQRPVVVSFGAQVGEHFRPRCIVVEVGTRVVFRGDLEQHPLTGGAAVDGQIYRDPSSPIPYVATGTEAAFVPLASGIYPFVCQVHWAIGMTGAIVVP
ncbi:MAG: hypothetical protein U0360_03585 [Dehalococcoidia bacterium]